MKMATHIAHLIPKVWKERAIPEEKKHKNRGSKLKNRGPKSKKRSKNVKMGTVNHMLISKDEKRAWFTEAKTRKTVQKTWKWPRI